VLEVISVSPNNWYRCKYGISGYARNTNLVVIILLAIVLTPIVVKTPDKRGHRDGSTTEAGKRSTTSKQ